MKMTRREMFKFSGLGVATATLGLGATSHSTLLSAAQKPSKQRSPYTMKKLFHGVCYYPELWPIAEIDRDIQEMLKLGINVVRMGEFSWSTTEPEQGKISLDLFTMVMDKCHAAGIDVIMCTPTATPPIWLTHGHPERCFKDENGVIMSHGARQHASYEHPEVQKACFTIIKAMAKEFGQHPALIGWQIDNEMKAHVAEDFSDAAVANWHQWLKNRFGRIEKLNDAWGTHMWSQHYQRFEQVPAPVKTPFLHSASLSTAYKMFCRESIADFMKAQSDILNQYSAAPVTHNDNPAFNIHHERSMQALDFASFDAYPSSEQWAALVFRSDMYRSAIPGRPFWLMETSVAHNGWLGNHHTLHPKGFLAAESALIYSLGGEGFSYWLWRQQRSGAELPHSAIMSSWFQPSVGYSQVKQVNESRQKLEPLLVNSTVQDAAIGITYSDHARAMIETEGLDKRQGFPRRYRDVVAMWHSYIMDLGFHRDVRFENAALDGLQVLITPAMPYVSEDFMQRTLAFVEQGGVWLVGPVTGTRGKEHTVPTTAGLGLLDKFAGVNTEFVVPLTDTGSKGTAFGITAELSGWCAAMQVKSGTQVIGRIDDGAAAERAFITQRKIGKGHIVVLGVQPFGDNAQAMIDAVLQHCIELAKVKGHYQVSQGTIVAPRVEADGRILWIVTNMNGEGGELTLPNGGTDALTGKAIASGKLSIEPFLWRAVYPKIKE
ncbi:beta-galactosidase [Flavobacterium sp. W21_SRS_FM6]|uniref:beta-galactosidase n=1 Tax=Flavobacterium sp. W21_SRS_FM6 TaxID=3240268 RepID=UPI003F9250E8